MKAADRLAASAVYIIGEDELKKKSGQLKNMKTAEQKEVPFDGLIAEFSAGCGCSDDGCHCE